MNKKLPLVIEDWSHTWGRGPVAKLSESLPFVINKMGVLVHRPKSVAIHQCGNRPQHLGMYLWCGAMHTGAMSGKFTFTSTPSETDIVCVKCEDAAVKFGHPSSDTLVGRHVHVGGVKAYRTCCLEEQDNE